MIYSRGYLARPLDAFFSNGSRVAVMRALWKSRGPSSGRALARGARVNHQAAAKALAVFEAFGVARRGGSGRNTLWALNRSSALFLYVLEPVFAVEEKFALSVVGVLQARLLRVAAGVIIHGSAAKGRLEAGAPFHFAAVTGRAGRAPLAAAVREAEKELREAWGLKAEGRVVSDAEAGRLSLFEGAWRVLPDEGPDWVAARYHR